MTLLPNGRSERSVLDEQAGAAKALQQLTDAYVARVRAIYRSLSTRQKREITPHMQALKEIARKGPRV